MASLSNIAPLELLNDCDNLSYKYCAPLELKLVQFFKKFCTDFNFKNEIITDAKKFNIEKGIAYISISGRILGRFLEQCKEKDLESGEDVGFFVV